MKTVATDIPEVVLLEPRLFGDERGFFYESWNQRTFADLVEPLDFVQDNHSRSSQHVLRGLHYQAPPHAQGKLVRVASGTVFDVAVDIRRTSPTFGQWVGETLSDQNRLQLWIPPGFAHGFLVMSESAELLYKTTEFFAPEADRSLAWDDPDLAIDWPLGDAEPILSEKDRLAPRMVEAELFD